MKIRYYFTLVRRLRLFNASPLSGFCHQRLISKMAAAGDFKDFGPLVGAIDQGTSSSRFLVSKISFKKVPREVLLQFSGNISEIA